MSVEERLRRGLAANTAHLQPSLDSTLGALLSRAQRRRRVRRTGFGLMAAAASVAGVLVFYGPEGSDRDTLGPAAPAPVPSATLAGPSPLEAMAGALPPGTYTAKFVNASSDVRAIVEVPDGFTAEDGFLFLDGGAEAASLRAIGFWTVAEVHTNPCYGGSADYFRPGPTAQDLATALARQPLRAGTDDPVPVSLGGYDGFYLELAAPADLDVSDCIANRVERWRFDQSDRRWHTTPGEFDQIWIIDVDDQRVVINAVHTPGTSQADIDLLTRTVESITFTNANEQ